MANVSVFFFLGGWVSDSVAQHSNALPNAETALRHCVQHNQASRKRAGKKGIAGTMGNSLAKRRFALLQPAVSHTPTPLPMPRQAPMSRSRRNAEQRARLATIIRNFAPLHESVVLPFPSLAPSHSSHPLFASAITCLLVWHARQWFATTVRDSDLVKTACAAVPSTTVLADRDSHSRLRHEEHEPTTVLTAAGKAYCDNREAIFADFTRAFLDAVNAAAAAATPSVSSPVVMQCVYL